MSGVVGASLGNPLFLIKARMQVSAQTMASACISWPAGILPGITRRSAAPVGSHLLSVAHMFIVLQL
jgi:hypothetical protein